MKLDKSYGPNLVSMMGSGNGINLSQGLGKHYSWNNWKNLRFNGDTVLLWMVSLCLWSRISNENNQTILLCEALEMLIALERVFPEVFDDMCLGEWKVFCILNGSI